MLLLSSTTKHTTNERQYNWNDITTRILQPFPLLHIQQQQNNIRTRNSNIDVGIGTDSNNFRMWDYTNSKAILTDAGGTVNLNGTAEFIKYNWTNEINFKGGRQDACIFNYRNADTGSQDGINAIGYYFENYGGDYTKSTLHAGYVNAHLNYDTLYSNDSGNTGSFNVSGDFNNYTFIEIIYKNNDGEFCSTRINNPYGKTSVLQVSHSNADYVYVKMKEIETWTSWIESKYSKEVRIGGGSVGNTGDINIAITKVLGWK